MYIKDVSTNTFFPEVETAKTRENREDRRLGLGRGGVELFKPRGVIGTNNFVPGYLGIMYSFVVFLL